MTKPSLTDVFGAGATQDVSTITIRKSDLAITASSSNDAESLLTAILNKSAANLTATNYASNPDQQLSIVPGFASIVYRQISGVSTAYFNQQLTVNFSKISTLSGVVADDY